MNIKCPHCKFIFDAKDITHALQNGHYKCPICGKKFLSPSADQSENTSSSMKKGKYLILVCTILIIIIAAFSFYLFASKEKTLPVTKAVIPAVTDHVSVPSPAVPSLPVETPVPQDPLAVPNTPPPTPKPDKMKIVERIAAVYHVSHSYTMEGGFVCLDMAIDVWNQLMTNGIDAKIMGGRIDQNITAWNYRQLALEGNHAWVVATISPTEKVAVETTAGKVIKQGSEQGVPYFKGIAFDSPAEIKRFELMRKATYANCRATSQMVNDWNENVAGKQLRPEDVIARKSQLEQRKADCENSFNALKEFESKAIFY